MVSVEMEISKWTRDVCWGKNQWNLLMKTVWDVRKCGEPIIIPRFLDRAAYWMVMLS